MWASLLGGIPGAFAGTPGGAGGAAALLACLVFSFVVWRATFYVKVDAKMSGYVRSNRSFDADTQRHCAAKHAGERTPRGAMPLRAGQLRR
jgi:hypothetical protein